MNAKKRIESLQVLRGLAFLGIYLSHVNEDKYANLGGWGVSVFLVLSGFLMVYQNYDKNYNLSPWSSLMFSAKRISKLYYLYIITMTSRLLLPVFFGKSTPLLEVKSNYKILLADLVLLQSWIPNKKYYFSLNSPAWFLSVCLFLYAAFPYVLFLIKKVKNKKQIVFCMLFIYALHLFIGYSAQFGFISNTSLMQLINNFSDNSVKWFCYINPLYRLGDFVLGCLLGLFYIYTYGYDGSEEKSSVQVRYTILEIFALFLYVIVRMICNRLIKAPLLNHGCFLYSGVYIPSSLIVVWVFVIEKGAITRTLHYKWLVFIGNYSMYTYLIHGPVLSYIRRIWKLLFSKDITIFQLNVTALIITLILSVLFEKHQKAVYARLHAA